MSIGTASNAPVRRGETWKLDRRRELLDAADRVIRRTGPAASMDAIASEAGVSRVVLYRYFGDKDGLYRAVADRYVEGLLITLRRALEATDDPEIRLRSTIDTYTGFIESNREVYSFLMHRAAREGVAIQTTVADFMRKVANEVGNILEREIASRGFDPAPAGIWATGVVGMVHLATDRWLESQEVSRDEFIDQLVGLLSFGFFGLAADPGAAARFGFRPTG